jgi:hypothetical protein
MTEDGCAHLFLPVNARIMAKDMHCCLPEQLPAWGILHQLLIHDWSVVSEVTLT